MDKDEIEFLVSKIKNGEKDLFYKLYEGLYPDLKKMSSQYFIAGSDGEDIMQECKIGLWKAITDYSPQKGMAFKNFAVNICCERHLITSVSHANRKKFIIHNTADSLESPTSDDDDTSLADFIPDHSDNVLDLIINDESFNETKDVLFSKLTRLEKNILNLYLGSNSYKEIAHKLKVKPKTVDNGLMRIRAKSKLLCFGIDEENNHEHDE